ncbi:hypothetical protein O6H91_06G129000 [Diphasiastrum complanatum]|uniref:Uncharacterized protein n=1 Tax=Diphasiastrum complanatum TaxID=34168 RepID=A0ACC2DJ10_DIPCM|nr:hypothetical protein O6H91_06G129000 [Diphasiastrum complanatum]
MGRAPCCSKLGLNRGPWTAEEDALLAKHVGAHGEGCWKGLPKAAGLLRCGKSCRLRWVNYLRPSVKRGNISEDEEDLIIKMHSLLGNRWSLIAARIPGRTDNEIKNYWNTYLSKKLTRRGIDPKSHKVLKTSGPQYAKADHNIHQPLNILDMIHTEKAPSSTDNYRKESFQSLAFLGSHCDRQEETSNTPTSPIDSDNEGDFAREVSSIKSDVEINKNGKEASSSYGSPRRSNCSNEQKSYNYVIDYDPISSLSYSSLENRQTVQPDRDNIRDYQHLEESVSISSASCSSDSFAYLGLPSYFAQNLSNTSSKCTSPSSHDQSTTFSSRSAIATASCLKTMPPHLVENDTTILSHYSIQFSVRELSSFEEKNSTNILPTSFEVDKALNHTETLSDIRSPVFSRDFAHARTLDSEEHIERDISNCVDKLATAEYLETIDQPFAQSHFWNISGCNANYLDFQENLTNFEWTQFDVLESEEEASFSLYQA